MCFRLWPNFRRGTDAATAINKRHPENFDEYGGKVCREPFGDARMINTHGQDQV
jgi:hypothetical protein